MEVIGSLIFENLDILLTSAFMFYPFFAVIWESFVVGTRIQQERRREAAILQRLVTQVDQTAKKIDELHFQSVAKNLLERPQLEAIVKSNETLGREVDYLSNTVKEEQGAIKELARFMYDKNRLVDALVMILKDLQQGLRVTNGDQAMIVQHFNNLVVEVNGAKGDIQLMDGILAEIKEALGKNVETNTKQFKDVYTKLAKQQKSTDAFKAWAERGLKMLISNPSAGGASNDLKALQVDLKHVKEYISTMRDDLLTNICECGPNMKLLEDQLKEQRKAIKDMLEDYREFKDDYYMSESVNGTAVQKVVDTLQQSYATREEIHIAFQQIHDDMIAGQCSCNSANTQQQPAQQKQEQKQEDQQKQEQKQGETQEETRPQDNMVVDP
ncbi:unnamed protein product [Mucor fragilis]